MSGEAPAVREALPVYATEAPETEHVPTGYRQTEMGVIPEDWKAASLQELSSFITKGSTPTTYGYKWETDGVLFLRSECVSENGLDLTQSMFIGFDAHAVLRRSEVYDGDILMTITGNVGRVVRLREFFGQANINQHIARVRVVASDAHAEFVLYFLSQPWVRKYYGSIITGQAYPQISLQQVRDTIISLPPLSEQRAIAAALSDVDALIAALDKLISKKRAVKTAAMQQLLTGKQRLPGFSGEWRMVRLGAYLRFQVGFPFSSNHFNQRGEGIRLVKNRDLKADDQVFFYDGPYEKTFLVSGGDVLVGMDGDFLPCLWRKGPALLNQRVGRVLPSTRIYPLFAYYSLAAPLREIEERTSSTTVKHLSHGDVANIESALPSFAEQSAIATVLSDMDAEIAALEARREKTRRIKQGMMQELLTGRTRLGKEGEGE